MTVKQPQDHKPKASTDHTGDTGDAHFSFSHNGETYTFEKPTVEALAPGFLRANRRRSPLDFQFTVFEHLAGDKILDVIDSMTREQYQQLSREFQTHSQITVGES